MKRKPKILIASLIGVTLVIVMAYLAITLALAAIGPEDLDGRKHFFASYLVNALTSLLVIVGVNDYYFRIDSESLGNRQASKFAFSDVWNFIPVVIALLIAASLINPGVSRNFLMLLAFTACPCSLGLIACSAIAYDEVKKFRSLAPHL